MRNETYRTGTVETQHPYYAFSVINESPWNTVRTTANICTKSRVMVPLLFYFCEFVLSCRPMLEHCHEKISRLLKSILFRLIALIMKRCHATVLDRLKWFNALSTLIPCLFFWVSAFPNIFRYMKLKEFWSKLQMSEVSFFSTILKVKSVVHCYKTWDIWVPPWNYYTIILITGNNKRLLCQFRRGNCRVPGKSNLL